tara:strand:- start:2500 stop:3762 length:1263 start_codon:yes stop_codon:yes gene_type:complete
MLSQSTKLYNQLAKKKPFNDKISFGLKRIKLALEKLGHPEKKLRNVINILGSDGKFSVLTFLKYFLENAGKSSSAFISPDLVSIRERFWMGKDYLSYKKIQETIKEIEKLKIPLTIFEKLTLIYIINASKKNNDYNLVEAGALFAKDSTNIFDFPVLQVVVNINKQHLNFLKKKTIDEVIYQKVAFLCQFSKIYVARQSKKNIKKIKYYLNKNKSEKIYSNSWHLKKNKFGLWYKDKNHSIKINNNNIFSKGLLDNLAMAIKISLDLGISKELIKRTLPKIRLNGRIHYIRNGKIKRRLKYREKLLIDGCHSQVSAKNFANYLRTVKGPKYGIWGMSKGKDPKNFIREFKGIFNDIFAVPFGSEKACFDPMKLAAIKIKGLNIKVGKNFNQAINKISDNKKKIICIFGSLYLCGDVLKKN